MELLKSLDTTTLMVLIASSVIIVLALFARFISGLMKIAIITAMIACILYFLRQEGLI